LQIHACTINTSYNVVGQKGDEEAGKINCSYIVPRPHHIQISYSINSKGKGTTAKLNQSVTWYIHKAKAVLTSSPSKGKKTVKL
jgi:hypothetical protein